MSRHRSSGSYRHGLSSLGGGDWRLHWTVDRYYSGARGRHPRISHLNTDTAGALRFCKRWGIPIPDKLKQESAD